MSSRSRDPGHMEDRVIVRLRQAWLSIRYSFWFVPSLLVLTATLLAVGSIAAGGWLGPHALDAWPHLFGAGASGARGLLATIASSMITVAGVVFSITLVALAQASSQYTSRVLRNFMSDRGNQVVLGAFLGIFAYCLIVLRTIRGGDEGMFVPSLAVFGGLLLGFVGIALLIYFIHHISTLIQASQILSSVSTDTIRAIDEIFPDPLDDGDQDEEGDPQEPGADWRPVPANSTGYIQTLDTDGLLQLAKKRDTVLRVEHYTGEFVIEGMPLVSILGVDPTEEDVEAVDAVYAVGRQRTIEQDAPFGIRQIVDVALKALSPGINDTTTAVMCVDHLTAILVCLTRRRIDSCHRSDDGALRLLGCGPTYASLVGKAFDQIRQNAAGNVAVLEAMLNSFALLATCTKSARRRRTLLEHALTVAELSRQSVTAFRDREHAEGRAIRTISALGEEVGPTSPSLH